MYKFLLIEDSETDIESFNETIERLNREKKETIYKLIVANCFKSGMELINKDFDGIIVDIKLDNDENGNEIIDEIMKKSRVPVVVYTGTPNVRDDIAAKVRVYTKGKDKQVDIIKYICSILDTGLSCVLGRTGIIEQKITEVFWENLYPLRELWMDYKSKDINTEKVLLRYALANIQEHFDITDNGDETCDDHYLAEEMYVKYINTVDSVNRLQTGAIVKGKDDNEKSFIILSPPCDLALHKGKFKSDRILLCEIENNKEVYNDLINSVKHIEKKQKLIKKLINNSYCNYYHWLPESKIFKGGCINFRKINTISLEEYKDQFEVPKFKVQEVFVKNILNRFSSYYSRQGQPDFDFEKESKSICEDL